MDIKRHCFAQICTRMCFDAKENKICLDAFGGPHKDSLRLGWVDHARFNRLMVRTVARNWGTKSKN